MGALHNRGSLAFFEGQHVNRFVAVQLKLAAAFNRTTSAVFNQPVSATVRKNLRVANQGRSHKFQLTRQTEVAFRSHRFDATCDAKCYVLQIYA